MKSHYLLHACMMTVIVASSLSLLPVEARSVQPSFSHTTGYLSLNQWAVRLQGQNFKTDPAFPAYCQKYAQVAQAQARRRIQSGCANRIPLSSWLIQKRWQRSRANHRNWCRTVSSFASGAETRTRENQLKRCITSPQQVTQQNCQRNNKFHKAAAHGNTNFVRRCLQAGVNVNLREKNQWTPLHSAARNGRITIVKLLVNHGASINPKDAYGRTPLDQAKIGNRPRVINFLISRGAD